MGSFLLQRRGVDFGRQLLANGRYMQMGRFLFCNANGRYMGSSAFSIFSNAVARDCLLSVSPDIVHLSIDC